ncbi:MAG TPA: RIO1 family regulatory kinase/ATPase [Acidimicrobiales bacterium]
MDAPWLIADPEEYDEYDLGPLKTGKEADVFLVERIAPDGRSCLLAHKRYRPRRVTKKGELERLGFQRAATFVNDRTYRDGRRFAKSRDQRAADKGSTYGRSLRGASWSAHEMETLERLWRAGVAVPYPVERTTDGLLMQYLGDRTAAAPRLAQAGLGRAEVATAAAQLVADLHRMVGAGVVHADLSVYNLLWWQDRVWVIDVPQAVDVAASSDAFEFLHRDLRNVGGWFNSKGIAFDADDVLADLVSSSFG